MFLCNIIEFDLQTKMKIHFSVVMKEETCLLQNTLNVYFPGIFISVIFLN